MESQIHSSESIRNKLSFLSYFSESIRPKWLILIDSL